jgi:hypothetical protein
MGAVLATLIVIVYVYYFPSSFMATLTQRDLWLNIVAWSSFLILTGAIVGNVITRLKAQVHQLKKLKQDQQSEIDKLEDWMMRLSTLDDKSSGETNRLEQAPKPALLSYEENLF